METAVSPRGRVRSAGFPHPGTLNSSVALRSLSAGPRLLLNARSASLAPLEAAGGIFPGEPTARGRLTTTFSTNC